MSQRRYAEPVDRNAAEPQTATSERRSSVRARANGEPPRSDLVTLIVGTYHEMPGLSLYVNQAARLLGLEATTCEVVLNDLVRAGQLRRSEDGQYRM